MFDVIAIPPGATIQDQIEDRGMSRKELASRMDMSEESLSRLINGDVQLTPYIAERLERVLGIPSGFWSNLEYIYREKLSKVEAENVLDDEGEFPSEIGAAQLKIPRDAEFNFLCFFARETPFDIDVSRTQFRALWTAYCLHHNLYVDTGSYDSDLARLWTAVKEDYDEDGPDTGDWSDFDSFDDFMCGDLV